jgi:hypothetical protein
MVQPSHSGKVKNTQHSAPTLIAILGNWYIFYAGISFVADPELSHKG